MQRKNLEQIRPSKGRAVYESAQYPPSSVNPKQNQEFTRTVSTTKSQYLKKNSNQSIPGFLLKIKVATILRESLSLIIKHLWLFITSSHQRMSKGSMKRTLVLLLQRLTASVSCASRSVFQKVLCHGCGLYLKQHLFPAFLK